ncbi:MAG: DNA-directed RNA polymerase subunit K [Candidatus Odinarchaeia archaeon]
MANTKNKSKKKTSTAKKKTKINFEVKLGPPILTRYERSRVIGARALQISMGAPILIDYKGKIDPIKVAEEELSQKILPIMIRREAPSGESQNIPISVLLKNF